NESSMTKSAVTGKNINGPAETETAVSTGLNTLASNSSRVGGLKADSRTALIWMMCSGNGNHPDREVHFPVFLKLCLAAAARLGRPGIFKIEPPAPPRGNRLAHRISMRKSPSC